jgi:hypothetical protein
MKIWFQWDVFMQGLQVLELMEQLLSHTWTLAVPAVGHLTCQITLRPYPSHHTAHLTHQTVSGGSSTDHLCFLHTWVNDVVSVGWDGKGNTVRMRNYVPNHENLCGRRGIAACILSLVLASCPSSFTSRERVPSNCLIGEAQSLSGHCGDVKNRWPLPGIGSRFLGCPAFKIITLLTQLC